MAKKIKKEDFPQFIHVGRESDGDGFKYLTAHDDGIQSFEAGNGVAIYRLVTVGYVKVTRKFIAPSGFEVAGGIPTELQAALDDVVP